MTARLIDGAAMAAAIRAEIAAEVATLVAAGDRRPGLGVVLVGDDPASAVYVGAKHAAAEKIGFHSAQVSLPASSTQDEVLDAVRRLNADPAIDGFLVQFPLPQQVDPDVVVRAMDPAKDVDCQHPENIARLAMGAPRVLPCTPAGIMEMLRRESVETRGREAVVVGRSNIVGRPMASLLLLADATVTVAHSRTRDLGEVTRRADILVVAIGRPGMVTAEMVKPGATVIDVGINRTLSAVPGGKDRLTGDVDPGVAEVAGLLTPVPRGVGPMTVAMLLRNTLEAARRSPAA
ncbi:MAG TPA: bifunctional 5,10-methylenetetrahydrofolate dehydrogenase/5,10-methenyltetrahydrofolate cyclohydrolase [Candidatus Dormibacteraeota bacterium]